MLRNALDEWVEFLGLAGLAIVSTILYLSCFVLLFLLSSLNIFWILSMIKKLLHTAKNFIYGLSLSKDEKNWAKHVYKWDYVKYVFYKKQADKLEKEGRLRVRNGKDYMPALYEFKGYDFVPGYVKFFTSESREDYEKMPGNAYVSKEELAKVMKDKIESDRNLCI